jgi:hypothetical protein
LEAQWIFVAQPRICGKLCLGASAPSERRKIVKNIARHSAIAALLLSGSLAAPTWATSATADLQNKGMDNKEVGTDGTTSLYAYSIQNATPDSAQIGPNADVTVTLISNGQPVEDAAKVPSPVESNYKIPVPKKGEKGTFNFSGTPTVALLKQDKGLLITDGDVEQINSTSGKFTGSAYQTNEDGTNFINAFALTMGLIKTAPGKAAGAAFDPYIVPGGQSYSYQPTIDASLESDADGKAGVVIYAVDSTTYTDSPDLDNFTEGNAPMSETLWSLSIASSGPISSSTQLSVDFEINPLALREINSSAFAGMTPSQIDDAVDLSLQQPGVWTISAGTATLTGFDPFSSNTTFTPFGGSVDYAEAVDAGIVETPLPASSIGGSILIVFLAAAKFSRRRIN